VCVCVCVCVYSFFVMLEMNEEAHKQTRLLSW
jgi:NO-binding membrane sensor protein with MHYT domain